MSLITSPTRLPLIAPSVLAADFADMGRDCREAIAAGADLLHLDVMDGHFVPNLTLGPDLCKALRRVLPGAYLDVHLMVTDPAKYFEPFAKAGANLVTFHVEVTPPDQIQVLAAQARALGMNVGLAINPPTPVERILPHVAAVDMVLVMSVNPGFAGQAFIPEVLSKTRAVREHLRPNQRLQMDGGLGLANARTVREAGCDVMVAGSSFFGVGQSGRAAVVAGLRG